MNTTRWISFACGVAILSSAPGCASLISGRHADVTFHSNVPNACVLVRDKHGEQVTVAPTESKVALKRKDGLIMPAHYTATISAPGYEPANVEVSSTVNPWILGNVVVGGVVGLVVDGATGAAWMPQEDSYYQELRPLTGPNIYGATVPTGSFAQQPLTAQQVAPTYSQFAQQAAIPPAAQAPPFVAAPAGAEPITQTAASTNAIPAATTYH